MKITLVPSSPSSGEMARNQFLTSFLINETIAVDAGSLGFYGSPWEQTRVRHVLLTHTHIDHIASLPIFIENTYDAQRDCVTIHGSEAVLDCLRRDVFNDRVWPDLFRLAPPGAPFLRFERLEEGCPIELDGLRITPVAVHHAVPTLGLIIEDPGAAVVIASDTGPTEEIWRLAKTTPNLKAVFLEAAFPDALATLATLAKHLTPTLFAAEARKLPMGVRLMVVHIKARYFAQITAELDALGLPNLEICQPGVAYDF
ncbi:MAG: 3',5'-cyclic-nucleotide phosphodiesterase [Isosphaeraceae bacterium]